MCEYSGVNIDALCDMTHSYMRHDPFMCVKTPRSTRGNVLFSWMCQFSNVNIDALCDMIHCYMGRDSFICVKIPLSRMNTAYLFVNVSVFTCECVSVHVWIPILFMIWLIHVCAVTHSWVVRHYSARWGTCHSCACVSFCTCGCTCPLWHDSFLYVPGRIHTCETPTQHDE